MQSYRLQLCIEQEGTIDCQMRLVLDRTREVEYKVWWVQARRIGTQRSRPDGLDAEGEKCRPSVSRGWGMRGSEEAAALHVSSAVLRVL